MAITGATRSLDLVLEGGGVKGIALLGAVSELERERYSFVNLAGTSAGAVVAALLAAGYSSSELTKIIGELDFSALLKDRPWYGAVPLLGPLAGLIATMGIYGGDRFLGHMRSLLSAKGVRTFGDLVIPEFRDEPKYRYRVRVVASDVTRRRMLVLPDDIAPYGIHPDDLDVALAVRMSMSIPYVFKPVRLAYSAGAEKCVIVDGGILSNFPVGLFDSPAQPEWPTFGLNLVSESKGRAEKFVPVTGPISLFRSMIETAIEARDERYIATHDFVRTIPIPTYGISAVDFGLSIEDKAMLFQSGERSARDFLKSWDFRNYIGRFRKEKVPSRRMVLQGLSSRAGKKRGHAA